MYQDRIINRLKKNRKIILLILVFSLFSIGSYYNYRETINLETTLSYTDEEVVGCNLESGFYNEDIEISLYPNTMLPDDVVIFYTINGDNPVDSGKVYLDKINISAEDEVRAISLQAVAFYKGEFSDIVYRTFFVGKNVHERYAYPVISITTINENLYDYEKGIFVTGITYQNYLDEGGNPEADKTLVPCNYNQRGDEWIRESYIEVFETDGQILASQGVGLGVTGGSSSGYDFKSLKLVANEIYDAENDKFEGSFWRDYEAVTDYSHNEQFNKILLKSGGQDYQETQLRWDVISELAEQAGLYPVANSKKVVVYLNGEYYGMMSMSEDYSKYNISNACGLDNNYVEIRKGTEDSCFKQIEDLFLADLNDEFNRNNLENVVDMEQFLLYYAIQIITNNVDWPNNNYSIWRYTGTQIEGNDYSDGRYRFLLYDVDLTYLPSDHWRKERFGYEILDELINGRSTIFSNVMQSEYYRTNFINLLCDLCNTTFCVENVQQILDEQVYEMKDEIYSLQGNLYNQGENWISSFQKYWEARVENVRTAIINRNKEMFANVKKYWKDLEEYTLRIYMPDGVEVICNSVYIQQNTSDGNFEGIYYKNNPVVLKTEMENRLIFEKWIINGQDVHEEELIITSDMIYGEELDITIVANEKSNKGVVINEISAKGPYDWIELYNCSSETIALDNYCLTDELENLEKYTCPSIYCSSGEIVTINGKYNNEMGAYLCNFNIKGGETLYLVNKNTHEVVDQIVIPEMTEKESYGRYRQSERFCFYSEPSKGLLNN